MKDVKTYEELCLYLDTGFTIVFNGSQVIAIETKSNLNRGIDTPSTEATIYGPKDATLAKLQNKYRYEILIKSSTNSDLNKALIIAQQIFNKCKKGAMRLKIDKDPYFMM